MENPRPAQVLIGVEEVTVNVTVSPLTIQDTVSLPSKKVTFPEHKLATGASAIMEIETKQSPT